MPVRITDPNTAYISVVEASRRLYVGRNQARKLLESAGVRRLHLPGRRPRYLAADVQALLEASIVGEGPGRRAS